MISQLLMIAVLVGFLVMWHVANIGRMNPGEELEEKFLSDMQYEMGLLPE